MSRIFTHPDGGWKVSTKCACGADATARCVGPRSVAESVLMAGILCPACQAKLDRPVAQAARFNKQLDHI